MARHRASNVPPAPLTPELAPKHQKLAKRALQEHLTLKQAWQQVLLAENVPQAATTTTLAQGKLTPAGPVLQAHGAQCWEQIPLLCVISAHQVPTARLKAL